MKSYELYFVAIINRCEHLKTSRLRKNHQPNRAIAEVLDMLNGDKELPATQKINAQYIDSRSGEA